jgi:hypothetical protein
MNDAKKPTATETNQVLPAAASAAPRPSPAVAGARPDAAGELDLAVEEIVRPELMKEGFVGQER